MKEGDRVKLVGMVGSAGEPLAKDTLREADEDMKVTFRDAGIGLQDEGVLVHIYPSGWAKVLFDNWPECIFTPLANLKVVT